MGIAYLLLGGNIGDRKLFLDSAIEMIARDVGRVVQTSSLYETEPWGFETKTSFLNQVVQIETQLSPQQTLAGIKKIEEKLGRKRGSEQYTSRSIDIDILLFDNLQFKDKDLQIPHARMHTRKFTLIPLAEIAGDINHPVLNVDVNRLNQACTDDLKVELYRDL